MLCTRNPSQLQLKGIEIVRREILARWPDYDVIVCASQAEDYLIRGQGRETVIFDLSVPRNVDPAVGALVYNIEQVHRLTEQKGSAEILELSEGYIWESVHQQSRIYQSKTQRGLESGERGSHPEYFPCRSQII